MIDRRRPTHGRPRHQALPHPFEPLDAPQIPPRPLVLQPLLHAGDEFALFVNLHPEDLLDPELVALPAPPKGERTATVLLVDMSRSMLLRGCYLAAKKVAIADDATAYGEGLANEVEKTLKEIGECLGLTRERVRQIQNEALFKLKRYLARRGENPILPRCFASARK